MKSAWISNLLLTAVITVSEGKLIVKYILFKLFLFQVVLVLGLHHIVQKNGKASFIVRLAGTMLLAQIHSGDTHIRTYLVIIW